MLQLFPGRDAATGSRCVHGSTGADHDAGAFDTSGEVVMGLPTALRRLSAGVGRLHVATAGRRRSAAHNRLRVEALEERVPVSGPVTLGAAGVAFDGPWNDLFGSPEPAPELLSASAAPVAPPPVQEVAADPGTAAIGAGGTSTESAGAPTDPQSAATTAAPDEGGVSSQDPVDAAPGGEIALSSLPTGPEASVATTTPDPSPDPFDPDPPAEPPATNPDLPGVPPAVSNPTPKPQSVEKPKAGDGAGQDAPPTDATPPAPVHTAATPDVSPAAGPTTPTVDVAPRRLRVGRGR